MSERQYQLEAGLKALAGLLNEFRRANMRDKKVERIGIEQHLKELSEKWNQKFPGLPESYFPYSSAIGVSRRGTRDRYLKTIIVKLLKDCPRDDKNRTIINPVCVFGRHARNIASSLKSFRVTATDIDPRFNRLYEFLMRGGTPDNYEFIQDDIFSPKVKMMPTAVVFFGACGSLSDAAMDYAIESNSPYLICRTCCHDNIGGNTDIRKRATLLNWAFRVKNYVYSQKKMKQNNYYFSEKYSMDRYPRSKAAKDLTCSDELLKISRHSVDSDICRTIIDMDRYLHLAEHGYNVWYRGEMFVAEKETENELSAFSGSVHTK
jgi:hypothetical protein